MRAKPKPFVRPIPGRIIGAALPCALVLSSLLPAQTASYSFVGRDCGNSSTQMLDVIGTPKLGSTFYMVISGSYMGPWQAWTLNFLFTGASNKNFFSLKLPFDISALSYGNHTFCGVLRNDVISVFRAPNLVPRVKVPFPVPNDRSLLGVSIYHQAFRIMGFYNPRYTTWRYLYDISRGGHGVIGT